MALSKHCTIPRCTILAASVAFAAAALADERDAPEADKGPEWFFLATPTAGYLHNTTNFTIKVPTGNGYEEHEASLTDDGFGTGLVFVGFYRYFSVTDVFFWFPDVNSSSILGNILYFSSTIPTKTFVEPFLGIGYAFVSTDTDYEDFAYELDQQYLGRPYVGHATFEQMAVENTVQAPFPKLGLKFKLPIQHWYVTPFYSLMDEEVQTHARSPGGGVKIYEKGRETGEPWLEVAVPPFDTEIEKQYVSHFVGADFLLDFNYFLQLRGKTYYNLTHDLWTVRIIGSFLFSDYVGVTAYVEYSEKITVTNTYVLVGPAFVFLPPGFMDRVRHGGKP